MQTHEDFGHRDKWMQSLREKADRMQAAGESKITAGDDGEPVVAKWQSNGFHVVQRPNDEHGILRISVGGGATPVPLNYLTFRGDHGACVDLLRKALVALEMRRD